MGKELLSLWIELPNTTFFCEAQNRRLLHNAWLQYYYSFQLRELHKLRFCVIYNLQICSSKRVLVINFNDSALLIQCAIINQLISFNQQPFKSFYHGGREASYIAQRLFIIYYYLNSIPSFGNLAFYLDIFRLNESLFCS